MGKRPWNYDSLAMLRRPIWSIAEDMMGQVVWYEEVSPAIEPRHALAKLLAQWANDGWQLEEFNSRNTHFFCHSGTERRQVGLTSSNPALGRAITVQR